MVCRRDIVWVWILLLACRLLPAALAADEETTSPAARLWELGQAAMRDGEVDAGIILYQQSLALDPELTRNHLSLAAAYMEKKDAVQAGDHLARYVEAHPEQHAIRARYAELQVRLQRFPEARKQFECLIADAQEQGPQAVSGMIEGHSRLVELARQAKDAYTEHLHRGIGLFLLARQRRTLPDPDGELPSEALLCQAAAELTLAQAERPDDARPCWYLYEVWTQLGQRQPALCRLRQAEAAALFSYLTPAERRGLQFAYAHYRAEQARDG